jgi:hypothetical protein
MLNSRLWIPTLRISIVYIPVNGVILEMGNVTKNVCAKNVAMIQVIVIMRSVHLVACGNV